VELKVISNEEKNIKLLKEVIDRASKEEKQAYEILNSKQILLIDSFSALISDWTKITESKKGNECPKDPTLHDKPVNDMSNTEFSEHMRRWNKHVIDFFTWSNSCISTNTEQIGIIGDLAKILFELFVLETEEKWLMLSIAIRSQPSLLKYIQRKEGDNQTTGL
jgi:hypothetical protein